MKCLCRITFCYGGVLTVQKSQLDQMGNEYFSTHTYEKQLLESMKKKTPFLTKDESEKACPKIFIFKVLQVGG